MTQCQILLHIEMLQSEGWDPQEVAFWASYFLDPFSRPDPWEFYCMFQDIVGEDEADDAGRGLEDWEDGWE